jgi:hypothetical protein
LYVARQMGCNAGAIETPRISTASAFCARPVLLRLLDSERVPHEKCLGELGSTTSHDLRCPSHRPTATRWRKNLWSKSWSKSAAISVAFQCAFFDRRRTPDQSPGSRLRKGPMTFS